MNALGLDGEFSEKCIEANRHNNETTTYYLLLKRFLKEGNISKADFSGKYFDKSAIEPNQRRNKNYSLKAEDIIRKSVSPPQKKMKSKSFYKDRKENESFMERSVKIPKNNKSKSRNNSKTKIKEKSILRERNEDRRYSNPKPVSRSASKKRKDLKDLSLMADEYHKPRVRVASTTKNKRSHQGSYLIGADTGIDWPLEPKWKGETSGKGRGALRRR